MAKFSSDAANSYNRGVMRWDDIFWAPLSFVLSLLLPKDRRLFVFGGRQMGGNTGPLFEQALASGIRAYWITTRTDILRSGHPQVLNARSLRGVWILSRAAMLVMTHSLGDFAPLQAPSRRVAIVNTWHGMPIKRISTADPEFMRRPHAQRNLREMRRYRAMIATSPAMAQIFSKTFSIPIDQVHCTGQPRTDVLFHPTTFDLAQAYAGQLPAHTKRILYCPTWRESEPTRLFPFTDFDKERLQEKLAELDAVLFVRTHPNDAARLSAADRRIVPLQGNIVPEITDVLELFDVLITDYSSIYYDYLLLDRPVIFLAYDLEAYTHAPGFFIPFAEIAAGERPASASEFLNALQTSLLGDDPYRGRRQRVAQLVYSVRDGNASDRVLSLLRSLVASP